MLEKKITKKERTPPRILYNGTCLGYLNRCIKHTGKIIGSPIYLTTSPNEARSFAMKRARQYNDISTVLIIDTKKLENNMKYDSSCIWTINYLIMNSFYPIFKKRTRTHGGYCSVKEWIALEDSINYWTDQIKLLSKSELKSKNKIIFQKSFGV